MLPMVRPLINCCKNITYPYSFLYVVGLFLQEHVEKLGFSDFLKKKLKGLKVSSGDQAAYTDMMERLESCSFLPKQRDTDNRVIPQQLYRQELAAILERAEGYLPVLCERDADGLTVSEKLLSIFDFRTISCYIIKRLTKNFFQPL